VPTVQCGPLNSDGEKFLSEFRVFRVFRGF
jgi:hypothetical protein